MQKIFILLFLKNPKSRSSRIYDNDKFSFLYDRRAHTRSSLSHTRAERAACGPTRGTITTNIALEKRRGCDLGRAAARTL